MFSKSNQNHGHAFRRLKSKQRLYFHGVAYNFYLTQTKSDLWRSGRGWMEWRYETALAHWKSQEMPWPKLYSVLGELCSTVNTHNTLTD